MVSNAGPAIRRGEEIIDVNINLPANLRSRSWSRARLSAQSMIEGSVEHDHERNRRATRERSPARR
jgi:hypothetical protein